MGIEKLSKRPILIPAPIVLGGATLSRHPLAGPQLGTNLGLISVTLTPAQFITLETAAINLIPAPYSNQLIVVNWVLVEMKYNSVQYTGGGPLTFPYHGTGTLVHGGSGIADTVFQAAASSYTLLEPQTANLVLTADAGLGIDAAVSSANFAAGNSSLYVTFSYAILTLQ